MAKADAAKPNEEKGVATADAPPDATKLMAMIRRAEKGDARALADVRALLKAHPSMWDAVSVDLARAARGSLLKAMTGPNELAADAIARDMAAMKRKVAGDNPSQLESLLAERICMCWLRVQYAEMTYANIANKSVTFANGDYIQRQVERANRQYLAAIRTLAQVRKLGLPSVQVNIGEKQVNIAAGPHANIPAKTERPGDAAIDGTARE